MKKKLIAAFTLFILSMAMMGITAYAQWVYGEGVKWQNTDGSFCKGGWYWIDPDNDRLCFSYYFDEQGNRLDDTITPDGYYVNYSGQYMEGDEIITKYKEFTPEEFDAWLFSHIPGLRKDSKGIRYIWGYTGSSTPEAMYRTGCWKWVDRNNDGLDECYYFDEDRYMVKGTTLLDGSQVDDNGAWIVNGVVQTQKTPMPVQNPMSMSIRRPRGTEIMNSGSTGRITMNAELQAYVRGEGGYSDFHEKYTLTNDETDQYGYRRAQSIYRNQVIKLSGFGGSDYIPGFCGTVAQMFDSVPEGGIEAEAMYENTGYEKGGIFASTGSMDIDFGLPTGQYRVLQLKDRANKAECYIVVTIGSDGNWYIYPENQAKLKQN